MLLRRDHPMLASLCVSAQTVWNAHRSLSLRLIQQARGEWTERAGVVVEGRTVPDFTTRYLSGLQCVVSTMFVIPRKVRNRPVSERSNGILTRESGAELVTPPRVRVVVC